MFEGLFEKLQFDHVLVTRCFCEGRPRREKTISSVINFLRSGTRWQRSDCFDLKTLASRRGTGRND